MPRCAFATLVAVVMAALSAHGAQVSVAISSGSCRRAGDCVPGEECRQNRCIFSASGRVMPKWRNLPNGSICLTNKNCRNLCRNMRCTTDTPVGPPCKTSKTCEGLLVCKYRKCAPPGSMRKPSPRGKKKNGQKCIWNAECRNVCIHRRCGMPRSAGHECWLTSDCKGALVCKRSKCQARRVNGKANGAKCKFDYHCKNVCIFGKCRDLRGMGETCMKGIQCKKRLSCRNGKCIARRW